MLQRLELLKHDHFQYIITGDESWFRFYYDHKRKWIMDIDEIDERIEPTNYDKKLMIIIFIGIKGLVLLTHKPAYQSINSNFFIENVLKPLEEITNVKDVKKKRKVMYIHFDNAPAHSSCVVKDYFKSSLLKQLPHPPYSPDLAPCDFGLLGTILCRLFYGELIKSYVFEFLQMICVWYW